ncbi:MAG: hypothetical protein HOH58_17255 [Opitutaceae bacterium]|jgi:hypothetical protein|nr:hypothetical protein [Opitutaceae bacterium]
MARLTPEQLEQKIHAVLREQPARRAPMSLEQRVLGEIARRQALPWWQRSFVYWPNSVRLAFLVIATGIAGAVLLFSMQLLGLVSADSVTQIVEPVQGAWNTLRVAGSTIGGLIAPNMPELNATYLYVGLAVVGGAYAVMLGLGATAYRLLWQNR